MDDPLEHMLSKLSPVAGDVLVLRCPVEATFDQVLLVLKHINMIAPEGVSVAALDANFTLMMCNVPEFLAMINKPEVTH